MNKLIQWFLIATAGIFFFFFFVVLYFPFDLVIQHYLSSLTAQTKGEYRVAIGEIDPGVVFKTRFTKVQVYKKTSGVERLILDVPEMKVGVSYLSLLAGNLESSFIIKGTKGGVEGDLSVSKDDILMDAEFSQFSLSHVPYIKEMILLPLEGTVSGIVDMHWSTKEMNNTHGKVKLDLNDWKIAPGKIGPFMGAELEVPMVVLSEKKGGKIELEIEKGRVNMKQFLLPGPDLKLQLAGRIQLQPRFNLSRVTLSGSFNFSPAVQEVFGLIVVMIDKQKNEQGEFPLSISGRITKPEIKVGAMNIL